MAEATIDIETWKQWQAVGRAAQLVDVRSAREFATVHIPGAVNIPLEQLRLRTADLNAGASVVLVCQGGTRARLAYKLLQSRRSDLFLLDGGTMAWLKAGNANVRCTASRWALERQVRLIAGLLVAVGVALALTVSEWWMILPAFVGCGLTFAGISDICAMGEILARMPWNAQRSPDATEPPPLPSGFTCACELLPSEEEQLPQQG
jgi:rhodanese-related sulfurtransferase